MRFSLSKKCWQMVALGNHKDERVGVSLEDIAEQLGTVLMSDYLIMRLPIALSEGANNWTVNAEAGRKGNAHSF